MNVNGRVHNDGSTTCQVSCRHSGPHTYRILVIDDELTVCKSCDKILREDGYFVSIAQGGGEGLERARKEEFDLVLVDLKMPDIDGMEVVEILKREQPDTTVIIMTGYSTVPSAVKGIKLGAADYISKPFTPEEMSTAVKKALQHKEQQEHQANTKAAGLLINTEAILSVLTRAAEDNAFVARLSDAGSDILEEYDLTPEEKAALVSVIQPSDEETMLVVSHELKSPLSSIASLAKAMQQPNITGDRKEKFLNRIVTRAERALGMIEEYLMLSRICAGEVAFDLKRINFYTDVIQQALDDQREALAENGMSVRLEIPEKLEVVCDPEYMRIVYNNLISNATKYGTTETEIALGYSGLREDYHSFNVANVGEWIKESDRKRIFEKFVTLGRRGTGVGLHATQEIIQQHGGKIWVEPCYFIEGMCLAEKAIIKKADETLLTGNNFIFTIHEDNNLVEK
jgi:signal transduction histidine kinase